MQTISRNGTANSQAHNINNETLRYQQDLLAITGSIEETMRLLSLAPSPSKLRNLTPEEIGNVALHTALKLGFQSAFPPSGRPKPLTSWHMVLPIVAHHTVNIASERLILIPVDGELHPIAVIEEQQGTPDEIGISVAKVIGAITRLHAEGLYIVHNHPDNSHNDLSLEDIRMTKFMSFACDLSGATLLDHIVTDATGRNGTSIRETYPDLFNSQDLFAALAKELGKTEL